MNRFAWRQHRKQFLIMGILLAIYAAVLIPTGIHFWHVFHQTLDNCRQNPATPGCSDLQDNLFQSKLDQLIFGLMPAVPLFLPIIVGMFWGAPFLAREYSEGTNSLAWTQSVSRRKWLSVQLAWILGATLVFVGAFVALNTWWSRTPNTINLDRFSQDVYFRTQNLVPVAYALFAVSFGIMFGAWFRKLMTAIGLTIAAFIVVANIIMPHIRPYYMTPLTITSSMSSTIGSETPVGSLVVTRNIVNKNGQVLNNFDVSNFPPGCQKLTQDIQVPDNSQAAHVKAVGGDPVNDCLNKYGYRQIAKYQPASRYWDFQRIEAAIYVGLSIIAIGVTYWLVLKRDA